MSLARTALTSTPSFPSLPFAPCPIIHYALSKVPREAGRPGSNTDCVWIEAGGLQRGGAEEGRFAQKGNNRVVCLKRANPGCQSPTVNGPRALPC